MEKVARVPVWILFPGLDPCLWSDVVLSKIASKLGKPLFADIATTNKEQLSFARVMVEIDVSLPLFDFVTVNAPFLGQFSQKVVYEWVPFYCSGYGKLVNKNTSCKWLKQAAPASPKASRDGACSQEVQIVLDKEKRDSLSPSPPMVVILKRPSVSNKKEAAPSKTPAKLPTKASSPLSIANKFHVFEQGEITPDGLPVDLGVELGGTLETVPELRVDQWGNGGSELGQRSPYSPSLISVQGSKKHSEFSVLLETRVKECRAARITHTHFRDWVFLNNYGKHYNGRIWILLNPKTTALLSQRIEEQFIHLYFKHFESNLQFYVSFVYGSNNAQERGQLWSGLHDVSTPDPCLVLGNFNIVRDPDEKLSKTPPVLQDMLDFNSCLSACHLDDLSSTGCDLTWTNK
ncbi:uncharacterized protein LOC141656846 [Silene latifolia]|uniref:uncharacterized protein LOC141656846 n=1 Tax=Silene latifolia TaxID=37657 RepID=UPI003D76EA7C